MNTISESLEPLCRLCTKALAISSHLKRLNISARLFEISVLNSDIHMLAKRSPDSVWVNQETSRGQSTGLSPILLLQSSLLLLSSACGHNRFDTRVLMNLISLMCLCSLSPQSLLLFNGVLQSYLIRPLVVSQHAGNIDSK